jgi:hypothetical protein
VYYYFSLLLSIIDKTEQIMLLCIIDINLTNDKIKVHDFSRSFIYGIRPVLAQIVMQTSLERNQREVYGDLFLQSADRGRR